MDSTWGRGRIHVDLADRLAVVLRQCMRKLGRENGRTIFDMVGDSWNWQRKNPDGYGA